MYVYTYNCSQHIARLYPAGGIAIGLYVHNIVYFVSISGEAKGIEQVSVGVIFFTVEVSLICLELYINVKITVIRVKQISSWVTS